MNAPQIQRGCFRTASECGCREPGAGGLRLLQNFDSQRGREECGREELNLHALWGHRLLRPACLPIPPRPLIGNLFTTFTGTSTSANRVLRCGAGAYGLVPSAASVSFGLSKMGSPLILWFGRLARLFDHNQQYGRGRPCHAFNTSGGEPKNVGAGTPFPTAIFVTARATIC